MTDYLIVAMLFGLYFRNSVEDGNAPVFQFIFAGVSIVWGVRYLIAVVAQV